MDLLGRRAFTYSLFAIAVLSTLGAGPSYAQSNPQAISLGGELFLPDGTPVASTNVNFRVQVFDASETCVLYSENHLGVDLKSSAGRFNLVLGAGSGGVNNISGSTTLDARIFANVGVVPVANCSQSTVALVAGQNRQIRIFYDVGAGPVALSPDVPLVSSAYAMLADSLQGKGAADFLQIVDNGTTALNQSNADYAFSTINWPRLKALLDGTSSQYLPTTPTAPVDLHNQRIVAVADPTGAQDVATKHYADTMVAGYGVDLTNVGPMTGNNNVLLWDAAANKWVAGSVSSAPTGAAGGDLAGTYPNPTIKNDAVTAAKIASTGGGPNRLLITDPTTGATIGYGTCAVNEIYAWTATGWACASVASLSPVTSVAGRTGAITLGPVDISGLGTAALYDWGTGANQIPRLDASSRLPTVDGSQLTNVNATQLQLRPIGTTAPLPGQVLGFNGTAWLPVSSASGSVTSVATGNGLFGGPITSSGTISVDAGTTANKIVQLDTFAKLPALDGANLFNVKLATRPVATTAPGAGQVLGFNVTTTQWEPTTASTGSVTNVTGGLGLVGGSITTAGTLNVDVGTIANKILQLDPTAKIPAVDGSLLYNVNATKIGTRTIASTLPNAGQVLGWNASLSQWEPSAGNTNSVTMIQTSTGLLGGPITTTGTLSVDVGSSAAKIVQENANAQIAQLAGSAALPAYAFSGNTNTGLFSPGAGALALTANGTAALNVLANGAVGIGTAAPAYKVHAAGDIVSTTKLGVFYTSYADLTLANDGTVYQNGGDPFTRIQAVGGGNARVVLQSNNFGATATDAGHETGRIDFGGFDGATWLDQTASVKGVAETNWSGAAHDEALSFSTTNGTSIGERLRITGSGRIGVGTSVPQAGFDIATTGTAGSALLVPRDTTANRPAGVNGMIRYNSTLNAMEAYINNVWATLSATGAGTSAGTVTNVFASTGLLGGSITTTGTLAVDVGTAANKILQLNANAQLPAVDASLLYNVNATRLATRAVSSAAPTMGQVLGFNVSTTQWEPTTAATGSVQSVGSGTGLIGGPITTNGTLSVDVGSAAAKIVQENANAQIAQLAGSAALPAYTFSGNTNTGLYSPGANSVALSANGTAAVTVSSSGNVGIGTSSPGQSLSVVGSITVDAGAANTGTLANSLIFGGDGDGEAIASNRTAGGNAYGLDFYTASQNRMAITNGGNVGIGTATPNSPVEITRDLGVSSGYHWLTAMYRATGNFSGILMGYLSDGTTDTAGVLYSARALTLYTGVGGGTAERMRIDVTGKVGIGTNAPAAGLDVATTGTGGSALIVPRDSTANRPSVPVNGMLRYNNTSNAMEGYINNAWATLSSGSSAGSVTNVASGTGLLGGPITSVGTLNVDVGTAASKIVQLNSNSQIAIAGGSVSLPSHSFANSPGVGMYSPAANQLALVTNGTAALTIGSTGNVGIGSTAPVSALDISGGTLTLNSTGNSTLSGSAAGTVTAVTNGAGFLINYAAGNRGAFTNDVTLQSLDATTGIHLKNGANEILTVTKNFVGIGTTLPQAPLDVATTGTGGSAIIVPRDSTTNRPSNPVNGMLRYNNTSNAMEGYINNAWATLSSGSSAGSVTNVASGTGLLGGPITSTGTLSVDVGSAAAKIVQENANAQIAQTIGTASLPSYSFSGNTNTGFYSPGANQLGLVANGTTALSVAASGYVGIGSNSPIVPLDVLGIGQFASSSGTIASNLVVFNSHPTSAADRGAGLRFRIGANVDIGQVAAALTAAANTDSYLSFTNRTAGTLTEKMRIDNMGNVGVGTATPLAALDVFATGTGNSAILVPRDSTANRPSNPVNGMLRYNSTLGAMEGYINSAWATLASGSSAGTLTSVTASTGLLGGVITTTGTVAVDVGSAATKIVQENANAQIAQLAGTAALPSYTFAGSTNTGLFSPSTNALTIVTNGSAALTAASSGWIGIGSTAPAAPLNVASTSTMTSGTSDGLLTSLAVQPTASSSTNYNGFRSSMVENTTNATNGSTRAIVAEVFSNGANTSSELTGIYTNVLQNHNSGVTGSMRGTSNDIANINGTVSSAYGTYNYTRNANSGSISDAFGTYDWVRNVNGGSISRAYGSANRIENDGTGTIGTAYGFLAYTPINPSGTITNYYGLYVQNPTGLATNPYGIYVEGGRSFFGGNVGIGTSAPLAALDVTATGTGNSAIIVPRDSTANRPSNPVNGMLRYNNTSNAMEGYINSAWATISSGSSAGTLTNVATGTGLLGGPITTTGTLSVDVGSAAGKIVQENGNAQITQSNGVVALPAFAFANSPATGIYSPGMNQLSFAANGTAAMSILANGFIGVGKTNPVSLLDIAGSDTNAQINLANLNSSAARYPAIFITDYTGGNGGSAGVNLVAARGTSGTPSAVVAGDSLGTISGWGQYDATSGHTGQGAYVSFVAETNYSGTNYPTFVSISTTSVGSTSPNERMRISAAGNIGIGTNAPAAGLDIATTGTGGSAMIVPRDSTANRPSVPVNGMIRYNNSNAKFEAYEGGAWANMIGGGGTPGGSTTQVQYNNGGAFAGSSNFVWDNANGRLGIGTTSPTQALQIVGGAASSGSLMQLGPSTSSDATATIQLTGKQGGVAVDSYVGAGQDGTLLYQSGNNAHQFRAAGGTVEMTISTTGNVGIGTAAPGAGTALSVEGQIRTKSGSITTGSVDWSLGNAITTTFDCGSNISFAHLRDGGSYRLVVTGTGTSQCGFNTTTSGDDAGTVTYRFNPANSTRAANSHTIYSLMRVGNVVYISWTTGF